MHSTLKRAAVGLGLTAGTLLALTSTAGAATVRSVDTVAIVSTDLALTDGVVLRPIATDEVISVRPVLGRGGDRGLGLGGGLGPVPAPAPGIKPIVVVEAARSAGRTVSDVALGLGGGLGPVPAPAPGIKPVIVQTAQQVGRTVSDAALGLGGGLGPVPAPAPGIKPIDSVEIIAAPSLNVG